jgi:hypothetical protein
MRLKFRGGNELLLLVLDRKNKKAKLSSSKTHYQLKDIEWKQLFDQGKERIQERITDKLTDEQFKQVIILSMAKEGYQCLS